MGDNEIEMIRNVARAHRFYLGDEDDEVCSECGGTGTVEVGEFDDIISKPCICTMDEDMYDPDTRD